MQAILKKLKFATQNSILPTTVIMYFAKIDGMDDEDLYSFRTSLATQCLPQGVKVRDFMESPRMIEEAQNVMSALIGRKFEINLYDISVEELTKGRYVALDEEVVTSDSRDPYGYYDTDTKRVTSIRRASYKDKEDVIKERLLWLCRMGSGGTVVGIDKNGKDHEIGYDLIQESTEYLAKIKVPYSNYDNVSFNFIIKSAPIKEIDFGFALSAKINGYKVNQLHASDNSQFLKEYRQYLDAVEYNNSSLSSILRFWRPKEKAISFEEFYSAKRSKLFHLPFADFIKLMRDSYILSKSNPNECRTANKEVSEESYRSLSNKFMGGSYDSDKIREAFREFNLQQKEKYKGKTKIRVID